MSVGNKYNSPGNDDAHYRGDIQPIDFLQSYRMELEPANVIKYVCRHDRKAGRLDLEKAMWYLNLMKDRNTLVPLRSLRSLQLVASLVGASAWLGDSTLDPIPLSSFFEAQPQLGESEQSIIENIVFYKTTGDVTFLSLAESTLRTLIEGYGD